MMQPNEKSPMQFKQQYTRTCTGVFYNYLMLIHRYIEVATICCTRTQYIYSRGNSMLQYSCTTLILYCDNMGLPSPVTAGPLLHLPTLWTIFRGEMFNLVSDAPCPWETHRIFINIISAQHPLHTYQFQSVKGIRCPNQERLLTVVFHSFYRGEILLREAYVFSFASAV